MGEALDLADVHAGRLGELFDGRARSDPSLNVFGPQHAFDLDVPQGLTQRPVTADGGAQPVVHGDQEFVGRITTFANDGFAVDIEPDHLQFPHADLLRRHSNADSERSR
jgi:hypothetical protein